MTTGQLLLVEDDQTHREMLREALSGRGYAVEVAECGQGALDQISRQRFDVALLDIRLPDMGGMQLLGVLRERQPECLVLMMTGQAAVADAVEAMKLGAYDYLAKPFRVDLLLIKLERLLQYRLLRQQQEATAAELGYTVMIGRSAPIQRLLDQVESVAKTDATILLLGETGSGKGLLAKLIHERSRRRDNPLICVNCAAIPENLLEAELFGFEKGAFTGAHRQHPGLLEQAHGGTLFLDEVGDMPPGAQVKLLRALEERVVNRLGGTRPIAVDFRLLTATNRNLNRLRHDGAIREDFFYRLNVFPMTIPPLRDRREDIPLLVNHFFQKQTRRHQLPMPTLSAEVMERFSRYPWPGNVRELENLLERLQVLLPGKVIHPQDLPAGWGGGAGHGERVAACLSDRFDLACGDTGIRGALYSACSRRGTRQSRQDGGASRNFAQEPVGKAIGEQRSGYRAVTIREVYLTIRYFRIIFHLQARRYLGVTPCLFVVECFSFKKQGDSDWHQAC